MKEEERKIFDMYVQRYEILSQKFWLMTCLLDKKFVNRQVELLKLKKIYIYGGGPLGLQLYNTIHKMIDVVGVVDRTGEMYKTGDGIIDYRDDSIPALGLDELRSIYQNEPIIITPTEYYSEITNELCDFVPKEKQILIHEFCMWR